MSESTQRRAEWLVYANNLRKISELFDQVEDTVPMAITEAEGSDGAVRLVPSDFDSHIFGWIIADPETGELGFSQYLEPDFGTTFNTLSIDDLEAISTTLDGLDAIPSQGAPLEQAIPLLSTWDVEVAYGYAVDENGNGYFAFRHAEVDPSKPKPPVQGLW